MSVFYCKSALQAKKNQIKQWKKMQIQRDSVWHHMVYQQGNKSVALVDIKITT